MQYETIILELLSRIKKLEDDVEMLKKSQSAYDHNSSEKNDDMEVSVMSKRNLTNINLSVPCECRL